jgi:putative flippase GtrA
MRGMPTGAPLRWIKFNVVGLLGVAVQLVILSLLVRRGMHYLLATAIAVEAAVLHNYAWHVRWTWLDRPGRASRGSFLRFHVANGLVSIASNLVLMRVFTGGLGMAVLVANPIAIAITSILNFMLGDRWVFRQPASGQANPDSVEPHVEAAREPERSAQLFNCGVREP